MVRRDGAEVRKERIQEIGRIIHAALFKNKGGELPLKQVIARLQYETGLTPEKIREYLSILEDMDQFTIDQQRGTLKKISS